jgi:hypothetical protein
MRVRILLLPKARIQRLTVDTLSRIAHLNMLQAVSMVKHDWIQEVLHSYATDPRAQQLKQLAITSPDSAGYSLDSGLLRYKTKLWIG